MDKGVAPQGRKKSFLKQDDNIKLLRNCNKFLLRDIAENLEL